MSYTLLQISNIGVLWQCQAYSPNTLHRILIQYALTLAGAAASFKVHLFPRWSSGFHGQGRARKSCQVVMSVQRFGLQTNLAMSWLSLTDTFQILNPGLHWWKLTALKSDTSLFLWLVLTLTPASTVLYSAAACWKPDFQPRFLLKCAPPVTRTEGFAATLAQVNNHNGAVHVAFIPPSFQKCSFQALTALPMCVCSVGRVEVCLQASTAPQDWQPWQLGVE